MGSSSIRSTVAACTLGLLCTALGCSSGNDGSNRGADSDASTSDGGCLLGRSVPCACSDGSSGAQKCLPDGSFGACRCEGTEHDAGDTTAGGDAPDAGPADADAGGDDDGEHGLSSVRAESRFERDVSIPECDTSRSDVKIIDETSDWNAIDDGQFRLFCVQPGDYRDAGPIEIESSGTSDERRYLVYDGPDDAHPVDQSERAIVEALTLDDASFWTVSGLTVFVDGDDGEFGYRAGVTMRQGSNSNIFDRMLISGGEEFAERELYMTRGDGNTLQNSVLRNAKQAGTDELCVSVNAPGRNTVVRDNRVVSNELYDCTDGVQLVVTTSSQLGSSFPNTILAHNDMYFSPKFRTDGNGNFDEEGNWHCGEDAIDIKAAAESTDTEPVRVVGNRMWGMARTDTDCGGSGGPPAGKAVNIHRGGGKEQPTRGIELRNNVIFDVPRAISAKGDYIEIANNLAHDVGAADGWVSFALLVWDFDSSTIRNNTLHSPGARWAKFFDGAVGTLERNVFLDAGGVRDNSGQTAASKNAYYGDSDPLEEEPWIERSNTDDAANDEFCVTLRGYTDPREKCFPNVASTERSPHGVDTGFVPPFEP